MKLPQQIPDQHNIPSQEPVSRVPYYPVRNADVEGYTELQKPHPNGDFGPAGVYVVSTFDARPVQAIDFMTMTGNQLGTFGYTDQGWAPFGGPYNLIRTYYLVPAGRTAILREWEISGVPQAGEGGPPINANGASTFFWRLQFFVNGQLVPEYSPVIGAIPFGNVAGECYVVAPQSSVIEMRLTPGINGYSLGATFYQCLCAMRGNLLFYRGLPTDFEPATSATLPVHEQQPQGA